MPTLSLFQIFVLAGLLALYSVFIPSPKAVSENLEL